MDISLLTCSPGDELYSIFGHSALRIKDEHTGTDIVYNYGTFDFYDPYFYSKFVRGKLLYFLSQNNYKDFIYSYAQEQRAVAEQFLQLSCEQKKAIQQYIWKNMQEENRFYAYDFLYDNCTTRLRDIIEQFQDSSMKTGIIPQAADKTFRNALYDYLDKGHMHWSKLGIDLLLGYPVDQKMTNRQAMFLPEYLETAVDSTRKEGLKLVKEKRFLVPRFQHNSITSSFFSTPIFIFSVFFLIILIWSFLQHPFFIRSLNLLDTFLFTALGFLGCLLIFMWVGTDHKQTTHNFNVLWAWPTHIFWIFIKKKEKLKSIYLKILVSANMLILISWFLLPQQLNVSLIPIILLVAWRAWKNDSQQEKY